MSAVLKRISPASLLLAVVLACAMGSLALSDTAYAAKTSTPAKAKIASVTSRTPGKVKVVVKKAKGAKGYQYQVSPKKSFKGKSTVDKKVKKTNAVFSGLAQGKRYYVRVRAYKGSRYGKWSAVKSVVVRKKARANSGSGSSASPSSSTGGSSGASPTDGNSSASSSSSSPSANPADGGSSGSSGGKVDGGSSSGTSGNPSGGSTGGNEMHEIDAESGSSGASGTSGKTRNENELPAIPA